MASWHYTHWGVRVYLDDADTQTLIGHVSFNGNSLGALAAALAAMGITGALAAAAAVAAALLSVGASALGQCNSAKKGIVLNVLWVGVPWCRSQ